MEGEVDGWTEAADDGLSRWTEAARSGLNPWTERGESVAHWTEAVGGIIDTWTEAKTNSTTGRGSGSGFEVESEAGEALIRCEDEGVRLGAAPSLSTIPVQEVLLPEADVGSTVGADRSSLCGEVAAAESRRAVLGAGCLSIESSGAPRTEVDQPPGEGTNPR